MSKVSCGRCGAPLSEQAKFCGGCGSITASHRAESSRRRRESVAIQNRSVWALAALMAIPLAVAVALLSALEPDSNDAAILTFQAMGALAGVAATGILGWKTWKQALGATDWRHYASAIPVALACFAISWAYVFALQAGLPESPALLEEAPALGTVVISSLVLAPLVEEWICRSVAWEALTRIAKPSTTLLGSSVIFAILHGLGGGYFLEFPHRFVAGLGFGWLRARSGSIWPSVLAHALHNALAMAL